jgi:uncharacterized protein
VPGRAPTLAVLRAADRAAVPWKNGGGLTREVAVSPPGSRRGDFDWRVSIAEIGVAGPFSLFAGIDRRMAVLSGRLSLQIDGQAAVTLSNDDAAVAFPGEVPVFADPLGATVTDLNVMTRRGRCSATLTRRSAGESAVLEPCGATTLLIALTELIVVSGALEIELAPLDALAVGDAAPRVLPQGAGPASFAVVEIFR